MITRADYLNHLATHDEYYLEIAAEIGLAPRPEDSPEFAERVRHSLGNGDPHLNLIPLGTWDSKGSALMLYNGERVRAAFKARGDFVTLAGLVCLVKAAWRKAQEVPS